MICRGLGDGFVLLASACATASPVPFAMIIVLLSVKHNLIRGASVGHSMRIHPTLIRSHMA
jgi:uncharacterized protein (DUF697 family)